MIERLIASGMGTGLAKGVSQRAVKEVGYGARGEDWY